MYMTKEADYAVRIVHCITKKNGRIDARSISERTAVSLRFSLKILRKLVESGCVRSFKGKNGGYELARPAGEISLGEVIRVVDGPYLLSRCLQSDEMCEMDGGGACGFRKIYAEISTIISHKLDEVTFDTISDMV